MSPHPDTQTGRRESTLEFGPLTPLVLLLDGRGRVLQCSHALRGVTGSVEDLAAEGSLASILRQADARVVSSFLGGHSAIEQSWTVRGPTHNTRWSMLAIPVPGGGPAFVTVTAVQTSPDDPPSFGGHRRLLTDTPLCMWAFDRATFRFLAVNESAARAHGLSQDELESKRVLDVLPWGQVARFLTTHTRLKAGPSRTHRWEHRRRDGTTFELHGESIVAESAGHAVCVALASIGR